MRFFDAPGVTLSERESQILRYACNGFTDQAIANELGVSVATISTYWGRVRGKLGPHSRSELVAMYVRQRAHDALERLKNDNRELMKVLEEKNQQLSEVETALNMMSAVIQDAPDAILIVDQAARIRLANRVAHDLFGYDSGQLVGQMVSKLVPSELVENHENHMDNYLDNPERKRMGEHLATMAVKKSGERFMVSATLNAAHSKSGTLVTCIVRAV